jgi:hypothetical protein
MTASTSQTLGTPYGVADLSAWRVVPTREAGLDGLGHDLIKGIPESARE